MVRCPIHGDSLSVLVSPDIQEAIMSSGFLPRYERYIYTLEDTEVMWFVLSANYVAKNDIPSRHITPLPDDYPPWVASLRLACIPCLRSIDASLPAE